MLEEVKKQKQIEVSSSSDSDEEEGPLGEYFMLRKKQEIGLLKE